MSDILLITGKENARDAVVGSLADNGHRLTVFRDFQTGVRRLADQPRDAVIVVMDWPEREVGRRMRALRASAGDTALLILCRCVTVPTTTCCFRPMPSSCRRGCVARWRSASSTRGSRSSRTCCPSAPI